MNLKLKIHCIIPVAIFFLFMSVVFTPVRAKAADAPLIVDNANLLSDREEDELKKVMEPILEYGGVAFVTNAEDSEYSGYASDLAKQCCNDFFGGNSGTVLLIDMYNRRIEIYSTGKLHSYITQTRAEIITDNAYKYATRGDYITCATKCFEQILSVAQGGHINTPIRYVSNLFAAVCGALVITFGITYLTRSPSKFGKRVENVRQLNVRNMERGTVKIIHKEMTKQSKTLHSEGGSSGGGSSSGSSGGGGGGGGHSF